jgi:hypothetical protein
MGAGLLLLSATAIGASGVFAILQAVSGRFLPHDEAWLGMTAADLGTYLDGRIVGFMVHDRASFGGTLVAIAILQAWLVRGPLARGEAWAWWTIAVSSLAGFASFLAYLGYGYLDTWHGLATLLLLPVVVAGLVLSRPMPFRVPRSCPGRAAARAMAVGLGVGGGLVALAAAGMSIGGLVILAIGATTVFVPQDLAYLGADVPYLCAIHPGLVPLIAHDRAGFGGGLVATGIAALGVACCGTPSSGRLAALASAGAVGFGAAIGIHVGVGYIDPVHLGPAILGAAVLATGLGVAAPREVGLGRWAVRVAA